jgi:hypothetical protein
MRERVDRGTPRSDITGDPQGVANGKYGRDGDDECYCDKDVTESATTRILARCLCGDRV